MEFVVSIFLGLGLAAAAGFRIFVPFFCLGLAQYLGWVNAPDSMTWLGSPVALAFLGTATVVEILAYYIPVVDNFLDTISAPSAVIAGSLLMGNVMIDLPPMVNWAVAIIAGGGTAGIIKSGMTVTRAASTLLTGGTGNNIVNTTESVASAGISLSIFFIPIIMGSFVLLILVWAIWKLYQKFFGKEIVVA